MTLQDFLLHVKQNDAPDTAWFAQLQALWYAEKQDWDRAHKLCQRGDTANDAWIHANLHREEGDLPNARYWYNRAGKSEHTGSVETERHEIITALLE